MEKECSFCNHLESDHCKGQPQENRPEIKEIPASLLTPAEPLFSKIGNQSLEFTGAPCAIASITDGTSKGHLQPRLSEPARETTRDASSRPLLIDFFAGRLGWSAAFLARGWRAIAFDLVLPSMSIPEGVDYRLRDILTITTEELIALKPDFICASSPCEQFSVHAMKHFHPNPPYPALGIKLFEHTRALCEAAGVPYVMENVRAAQAFVGNAQRLCGPFALWGNAVPLLVPQGISKSRWFKRPGHPGNTCQESLKGKRARKAKLSTIPFELASCVCDYADRILA